MGSIARMDPKLPSKCRDVSWASPLTPNSKSFFPNINNFYDNNFYENKFIRLLLLNYNLHIPCLFQLNISLNVDFMAKKCTKSAISQFTTFTKLQ